MLQAFATSHNRHVSLFFLAAALICLVAASSVGINDNLPGVALAMLASLAVLLALAHPWRTETPFRYLLWGSLAALVPCGILEGLLESFAKSLHPGSALQIAIQSVAVFLFLVAVFVLPPAFLVGLFGSIVIHLRRRRSRA